MLAENAATAFASAGHHDIFDDVFVVVLRWDGLRQTEKNHVVKVITLAQSFDKRDRKVAIR